MKGKTIFTITLSVLCIAIMLGTTTLAVSNSDLTAINNEIKETENKLKSVESEKKSTLEDIRDLTVQISNYETEIDQMKSELSELEDSIDKKTKELSEKEEMYEDNYDKMVTRLVASYKLGKTSFLDFILSAKSIYELASNWYYLSVITEADMSFLETVEKSKTEIENTKTQLQNDKEAVEIKKQNIEKTAKSLEMAQAQKEKQAAALSAEEKSLQADLEQFEKDKKEIQRQLAEIAAREKTIITGNPSSHGYIFPVAGLGQGSISNRSYPSYAGHTGVDINIGVLGKSVVAVKAGTVEISTALYGSIANYDSNGSYIASYRSYGEYIVINHHDGTMTLYGHLKPGSRRVSVGETVQQGQVIATVGNTGNCMPRPTSSNPNNGTHLHFEVRVNGSPVNPIPYLP